ncbi:LppA family lipoprotein [Nocardia sp. JMUB6875]|uniref:LppA family lipoprotein n=1 Tax=Nocardia sp. JMUB6875 TaxID=3158170 RepID=UPI0034E8848B
MGDNNPKTTRQETEDAAQKLLKRPTLEEAEAQLTSVVDQIIAAATELVPGIHFETVYDRSTSLCDPPFDDTFGRKVTLQGHSGGPIPEDKWPAFLAKATELAGTVGATWTQKVREEPGTTTSSTPDPVPEYGRHDVNFFNPETGTTIRLGTDKATFVRGSVGCYLPKDKFDNPIRPTT